MSAAVNATASSPPSLTERRQARQRGELGTQSFPLRPREIHVERRSRGQRLLTPVPLAEGQQRLAWLCGLVGQMAQAIVNAAWTEDRLDIFDARARSPAAMCGFSARMAPPQPHRMSSVVIEPNAWHERRRGES